jgi:hypothetical protein
MGQLESNLQPRDSLVDIQNEEKIVQRIQDLGKKPTQP